ncbi:hypothetical protein [Terribacillus saccharophilus]|uniref:PEGA domain-containing protein n=1 Tax=Terribacillus saccharophilus TaxID=361277 RepID=A0ABX4GVF0_9BACI|nr:hypothetical protein [Terribacillus saccharophilus]PAD34527.1 hypothetical protein CHH56_14425 [Terribacillus saccharophilus]PAD95194.1 hypothetical protein CHH50_14660 [Terribacillus saccharophilus]PAD98855.1 hypothetical protein CHH48_15550 [Terribacillus saccharophilus]
MIEIKRERSLTDMLRNYNVIIDGKKVGTIGPRDTFNFSIAPGKHTIHLEIDWCRSKKIEFKARENEIIRFNCAGLRGIKFLFVMWFITFARNKYLSLNLK